MGLKLRQRAFLGGELRLPGHEVEAADERECRAYPAEVWEECGEELATPEPAVVAAEPIVETPPAPPAERAAKPTRGRGRG
jgi:hypothetical protein